MANTLPLQDNSAWIGKYGFDFYALALLTGDTVSLFKKYASVKSLQLIPRYDMSGLIQRSDGTYTSAGSSILSTKTLTVVPLKVNYTIIEDVLEQDFLSLQLPDGSNRADIPSDFEDFIKLQIAANVSQDTENLLFNGQAGVTGGYYGTAGTTVTATNYVLSLANGLFALLAGATTSDQAVTATGASANFGTTGSAITALTTVYKNIPKTIRYRDDLKIFLDTQAAAVYARDSASQATGSGAYFVGARPLDFLGIPLVPSPWLNGNMVAARCSNLFFGTDLSSDQIQIQLLDMWGITAERSVRFAMNFKWGVNYGVGPEIVWYQGS
jgi:hypothetical protein